MLKSAKRRQSTELCTGGRELKNSGFMPGELSVFTPSPAVHHPVEGRKWRNPRFAGSGLRALPHLCETTGGESQHFQTPLGGSLCHGTEEAGRFRWLSGPGLRALSAAWQQTDIGRRQLLEGKHSISHRWAQCFFHSDSQAVGLIPC
jgi:hypothetical protein